MSKFTDPLGVHFHAANEPPPEDSIKRAQRILREKLEAAEKAKRATPPKKA